MIRNGPYSGIFIPRDSSSVGHLKVAGNDSNLTIVGKEMCIQSEPEFVDIHGILNDGRKASLLDCIFNGQTHYRLDDNRQYETGFFPNFVVIGEDFINSNESIIRAIHYHFDNADHLVNGHLSFQSLHPTPEEARTILECDYHRREKISEKHGWGRDPFEPQISDHPHLLYYSGQWKIAECQTHIGKVSLVNRTSHSLGSAKGIGIKNEVTATIEFNKPLNINAAIHSLYTLHGLFELAIGSRQRYKWIEIELNYPMKNVEQKLYQRAELFWSNCNDRVDGELENSWPLLTADLRQEEFSKIVKEWMNTSAIMGDPRERFATAFFSRYGINRIVGAANMFDLLPESHAPKKKEIDAPTKTAVMQSQEIFKALPDSFAKQSVLSVLGRIGTASLRDKVFHRAEIIMDTDSVKFAELKLPCSQAVLCRNHYVHGSQASFDYHNNISEFAFITDTLEFVFAVSDLIEMGWDFASWRSRGLSFGHGLAAYMINYDANLQRLKTLLTD